MGLIGGTIRTVVIGALIGTVGYRVGNSRGYDTGMEEGKMAQRERDTLIARYEKAESARRLEGIAREAYERLRDQIHKEAAQPIDFSDARYDTLHKEGISRER